MTRKILFLTVCFTELLYSQINFENGTLFELFYKAENEKKVIMVDVYTDWCVWCVELERLVYSRPEVYNYANANLLNYKIDAEKGEGVAFSRKYKVEGFPTILFLTADGKEIDRIYGYYPAEEFMQMMTDYSNKRNTYSELTARLRNNPKDVETNYRFAEKLLAMNNTAEAGNYFKRVTELDQENKYGRRDDAEYMLALLSDDENSIKALEKFISSNPSSNKIRDAYLSLGEKCYNINSDLPSAEKYYSEALGKFPDDPKVILAYGRFLNMQARAIGRNESSTETDWNRGLELTEKALEYVKGSVSEAASYYWQSVFYLNKKDYISSLNCIEKALSIFNAKPYREQKEKVEKLLSSN